MGDGFWKPCGSVVLRDSLVGVNLGGGEMFLLWGVCWIWVSDEDRCESRWIREVRGAISLGRCRTGENLGSATQGRPSWFLDPFKVGHVAKCMPVGMLC